MSKYIDADLLRKEIDHRIDILEDVSIKCAKNDDMEMHAYYHGKAVSLQELLSFIGSLQEEQPSEICSKCIHHGKDDDYCYNPHGGMQSLINENGVYECTGFCEHEQPVEGLEEEIETYFKGWYMDETDQGYILHTPDDHAGLMSVKQVARHFYELGKKDMKEQMMNEAVEGEIQMRYSGCLCAKTIRAINEDEFKLGDKVRIIIVKEEK